MVVTSLLLGVLSGPTFEGGPLPNLAEHLWTESRAPIAIVSPVQFEVPKFTYEGSVESRAKALKSSARLIQPPGLTMAFYHEDFLRSLTAIRPVAKKTNLDFSRTFKEKPVFGDGKVTIRFQGNEGLLCSDLKSLPWSRSLDTHWTMDRAALIAHCASAPEAELLAAVAKAYAGRLVVKPKSYALVLDGGEFRRRALNLFQRYVNDEYFKKSNPAERASFNLTLIALRSATAKDIETAFATHESEAAIQLDYGTKEQVYNLLVSASRGIRSYELAQVDPRQQTSSLKESVSAGSGGAENFARRVDWNGPVTIWLSASFGARLEASSRPTQQVPAQKLQYSFPNFNQGREW